MPDKYNYRESEPKWVKFWEENNIFKFDPKAKGEIFSIDTPPPTVSGKMHIGHAFSYAQEDIIARYKRLRGFNVFYPWGTDDNGLATERMIEKLKNVKGSKMDRKEFIKLCEQTLNELLPAFIADWKRIGISCDFTKSYSTIDANCRRISQWSFIDLFRKGRAYRKEAPALWCILCETAIAQVELQDKEKQTQLIHVEVKTSTGEKLVFATTRPELMTSCIAISVHPDDKRYKHLVGKTATIPVSNAVVPIIADTLTEMEFGSGVVYWCPYGDYVDVEFVAKHPELKVKHVMNKDGRLNDKAGKYAGLTVKDARKKVMEDWQAAGAIKKIEQRNHVVNVHERCGTEIEFYVSNQWFIKYLDLKEKLLKWGAELNWYPSFMRHRYDNWVKGLKWDWCISRQRFFGVPFPVWYCKKCETPVLADEKSLPVDPLKDQPPTKECPNCKSKNFVPEKDIFDTWATSSLTPQLAIELVSKEHRSKLFPMSLRPQAHEIISFWLFNTVVKSRLHFDKNPWKDVALSGYVTDPLGEKMSKSKGNDIAPEAVLQKYSADALRYWAGGSKLGEDIAYQEKELISGDKFVTKLWNAVKFIDLHLQGYDGKGKVTETIDKWILARLAKAVEEATAAFDNYEYSKAKTAIESFFWRDLCDNYLELIKLRMYEPKTKEQKSSAQGALSVCFPAVVIMMAPFTPFITEEVYQLYLKDKLGKKSVHHTLWPSPPKVDTLAEEAGEIAVAVLAAVRKAKSEAKLSMKAPVKRLVIDAKTDLTGVLSDLKATTCAEKIELGKAKDEIAPTLKVTIEL